MKWKVGQSVKRIDKKNKVCKIIRLKDCHNYQNNLRDGFRCCKDCGGTYKTLDGEKSYWNSDCYGNISDGYMLIPIIDSLKSLLEE